MLSDPRRPPCFLRVSPIDPGQEIAQLRRRDCNASICQRWPDEATALKTPRKQERSLPIMPNDLQEVASFTAKAKNMTAQRILLQEDAVKAASAELYSDILVRACRNGWRYTRSQIENGKWIQAPPRRAETAAYRSGLHCL